MKFLCEACGELGEPAGVGSVDGAPALVCGACGRSTKLGGGVAQPAAAPAPGGPKLVPQGAPLARGPAQPTQLQSIPAELEQLRAQKGGKTRLMHGAQTARAEGTSAIARGWNDLIPRWEEAAAHDQLLEIALLQDGLQELGKLYATHLQTFPSDAVAKAARDRLVERASARYLAALPAEESGLKPHHAQKVRIAAAIVALLAIAGLALFLFRTMTGGGAPS